MRNLKPYIELVQTFVERRITDMEFERQYLDMFTDDDFVSEDADFDALNNLFYDVEEYCSDPTLRDPEDMDEEELRRKSAATLEQLKRLQAKQQSQTQ